MKHTAERFRSIAILHDSFFAKLADALDFSAAD